VKFRRNKPVAPDDETSADESGAGGTGAETAGAGAPATGADDMRARGPWDLSGGGLDPQDEARIDLGSLILTGRPGIEVQLQLDEASQEIMAVLLLTGEGAVELRPFAAPRNGDIWDDFRRQISAEVARQGGTATEAEGAYGTELRVLVNVLTPDGQTVTQPSRVLGIPGPRWLLRATLLGRAALEPQDDGDLESALRDVVVVRGTSPMAPGEPLPLVMPAGAAPVEPPV
jgi:hypothetical protein